MELVAGGEIRRPIFGRASYCARIGSLYDRLSVA
jgi:hypothetical protein